MPGDITPLGPVSPPPLVREKRHYPNEQKDKNLKKQEQNAQTEDEQPSDNGAGNDVLQKSVNGDKNNVKVGHIDEYA